MTPRPRAPASVADAALRYLQLGWAVVPCARFGDGHDSDGKAPRKYKDWRKLRFTEEEIPRHFGPSDNVGVILGAASGGLVDIDLDTPEAVRAAPLLLPPSQAVFGRPGAGFAHWLYRCEPGKIDKYEDPEPPPAPDGSGRLKACLCELRAEGGQTVFPPSLHVKSGETICWVKGVQLPPPEVKYPALRAALGRLAAAALIARRWTPGIKNPLTLELAGWWQREGVSLEDAELLLTAVCAAAGAPGDTEKTLDVARRSYAKKDSEPEAPAVGRTSLTDRLGEAVVRRLGDWLGFARRFAAPGTARGGEGGRVKNRAGVNAYRRELEVELGCTDVGNAERFLRRYGGLPERGQRPEDATPARVLYCSELGGWHIWDQTRWAWDALNKSLLMAAHTAKLIEAEAAADSDPDRQALLREWALKSQQTMRIRALLELASTNPGVAIRADELDADPWLLCCANGVLDLAPERWPEEGLPRLQPPDPAQRLSKLAPVAFDPAAECPRWRAFLADIFSGEQALVVFMARLLGYTLFGGNPEQVLVIFHGSGANGKSTLLETIHALLGDYAKTTSSEVLLARDNPGNNQHYSLAELKGVRFVTASEPDEGRRLAEGLVKAMTGGEQISARHPYGKFFTYRPEFTPLLATNHRPNVFGQDEGIWRRLLLVPFKVTIPRERRDPALGEKLREELPGILNWLLLGLKAYQLRRAHGQPGLAPPEGVLAANLEYRAEQDPLADFIADACTLAPGERSSKAELYRAYSRWAEENGARPVQERTFGRWIKALGGVADAKSGSVRLWRGIRPAHQDELQARQGEQGELEL